MFQALLVGIGHAIQPLVFANYYLQSLMCDRESLWIAILRSIFVSSLFIMVFPAFLGIKGLWIALPCSELLVTVIALRIIWKKNQTGCLP